VLAETIEDPARGRLARHITTFRRVGRGDRWRRTREVHRVRVPAKQELLRALAAAGFTARASRRYGAFELAPHRLAFVARRRRP
jgi:hypothetical protein